MKEASYQKASTRLVEYLRFFFDIAPTDRWRYASDFRNHYMRAVSGTRDGCYPPGVLSAWASDSYVHANGFTRLVVFTTSCGKFRLRLHVWPSGCPEEQLNVHDHRYSFASMVEEGVLTDVLWQISESGESFKRFRYGSRNATGLYTHHYCGDVTLKPYKTRTFNAGDLYSLASDELHYTVAGRGSTTVTLFAQDHRSLRPGAESYSRHHPVEQQDNFVPAVPPELYSAALHKYVRNFSTDAEPRSA